MGSRQGSWPVPGRLRPSIAAAADIDEAHDAEKALSFWVSEARKLPEDQRAFFLDGNQAESYSDYVEVLKDAVQQKADTSLVTRFSKKLLPVYHLANSIAPIATSASQLSPMPASLVLGGITCILSITASFDQYQNKIIETLEYMVDAVDNVNLYRDKKMFDSDDGVKTCEINLATDILEFCVTVANMFYNKQGKGKSSFRTALKMQGSPFEADLLEIKTKFEAHLRALEAQRQVVRSDWAKTTKEGVAELLESGYREKDKAAEDEPLRQKNEEAKEIQRQQRLFLEWLPSIDFSGSQEDHFERRVAGSGSWLIDHDMFRSWRESSSSTLLWVYGKPGSGKSHLAAKAIDELSHESSRTSTSATAYVYCSSTSSRKGVNFGGILASILAQLCRQFPPGEDFSRLIPRQDYGGGSGPTRREMRNGIAQALSKFQTSHIVIDGLDECHIWEDDRFREFCGFILELTTPLSRSTKVLVLSRPFYTEIERIVGNFPRIQVDNGANLLDLEHYISQKVEEVLRDPSEEERNEFRGIKEQLLKSSAGTFLWPGRKLSHLKEIGSIEGMSDAMENATEGLDDLYRQDIQRILTNPSSFIRERAMNALLWITNSRKPLSRAELIEALSVKRGQRGLSVRQRLSSSIPLCTECADLIVEKDGAFHLYHPSLRDFLVSKFQSIPGYDVLQRNADERLAEVCLTYLSFDIFGSTHIKSEKELKSVMRSFPLLQYASRNWGYHFSIASENQHDDIGVQQVLAKFLQTEGAMSLSLQVIFPKKSFPYLAQSSGASTALHIFAAHNLTGLARSLTDSEHLISCLDRALLRPIHYATLGENKEMAMWLLHCYDNHLERNRLIHHLSPNSEFSFLHMFAENDWDEGASLLLSFGCDCNARGDQYFGGTPLHHAAFLGTTRTAEVLVNADADLTALDGIGSTPLDRAVLSGNVEIVTRLASKLKARQKCSKDHELAGGRQPVKNAPEGTSSQNKCVEHANAKIDFAFLSACQFASSDVVAALLDHGANIEATNFNKSNGLHAAAARGHTEVLRTLLARCPGSNLINARYGKFITPLLAALIGRHPASAKLLLQHGAQPDVPDDFDEGFIMLPLWTAIDGGCYDVAELLMTTYGVAAGEKDFEIASKVGWSRIFELASPGGTLAVKDRGLFLLYEAAMKKQLDFCYKLIDAFPDLDIYSPETERSTVLHAAAFSGAAGLVEWLLKDKPSAAFVGNRRMELPIHYASRSGELECVKLLSAPEAINAEDSDGLTPLMLACRRGHLPVVQYLVQHGADANKRSRETGATVVLMSLKAWHTQVAKYLLEFGADSTTADFKQDTPLHNAACIGDVGLVKQLLDHGSEPSIKRVHGHTPLMVAVKYGRLEVVELLLAKDPTTSNIRGNYGTTCIHFAAGGTSTQILNLILKVSPELLQEVDENGLDAMYWAARSGRLEAIIVLANSGLSINGAPDNLLTPIEKAVTSGFTDIAREMTNRGANLEIDRVAEVNYKQRTPLFLAATNYQKQAASFLLEHGADPYLRDVFGFCAADHFIMNDWTHDFPQLHLSDYKPLDRVKQLAILQHTIVNTSEQILSKNGSQSPRARHEHIQLLSTLLDALLAFQSKTSLAFLHQAMAEPLQDKTCTWTFDCSFCYRRTQSQSFFICQKYGTEQTLCSSCHQSYLKSATEAGSLPVHILLLKELELAAFRVLKVLEMFKHDNGRRFSTCLRSVAVAGIWINAMLSAYKSLASNQSLQEKSLFYDLPDYTYDYVSLLDTIRKVQWLSTDEPNPLKQEEQNVTVEFILRRLDEIYHQFKFRPNYNPPRLFYHGQRYFFIDTETPEVASSKYLDDNKELKPNFYENVIAYYANVKIDEIDDLIADDPLPVRSNRQKADDDRIREVLRPTQDYAFPRFLEKTVRDFLMDKSFNQLWDTLEPLYEEREAVGDNTAELQVVDEKIQLYEVAWKMVHAMLDIPFERTVWEEKHYRQERLRETRRIAASEEVISDDGSEDSWHTADDAAPYEAVSDNAERV